MDGMSKEDLIKEIEAYFNNIIYINDCLTAYMSIYDGIQNYNKEINYSCGFFTITMYALNHEIILGLARLFEHGKGKGTIYNLINKVKSNQKIFTKFRIENDTPEYQRISAKIQVQNNGAIKLKPYLEAMENEFNDANLIKVTNSLKGRRDQYLAHNDKNFFFKGTNPNEKYPFDLCDIKMLIDSMVFYLQPLLLFFNDAEPYPKSENAGDLKKILMKLADAKAEPQM